MKPLGRLPSRFPNKTNCNPIPKSKIINWWESEMQCGSKEYDKRMVEKEIEEGKKDYLIHNFYYSWIKK